MSNWERSILQKRKKALENRNEEARMTTEWEKEVLSYEKHTPQTPQTQRFGQVNTPQTSAVSPSKVRRIIKNPVVVDGYNNIVKL